jgi:hypothetical protein
MRIKCLISIPLLAGAILWLLVGCSGESATKFPPGQLPYRTYSDDYDDFSIRFPQSWSLQENTDGLAVNATGSKVHDTDPYQPTAGVIVTQMDVYRSLDDFHIRNIAALADIYSDYAFHKKAEGNTVIEGKCAKILEFTYTSDNQTIYNQEFEMVVDDRAYIVLNTATNEDFPTIRELFAEIGHSLSISYSCRALTTKPAPPLTSGQMAPAVRAAITAGRETQTGTVYGE